MGQIINTGRADIAQKAPAGQAPKVTHFVLANIPGLDPATAVDLTQSWPANDKIVYTGAVTQAGYVNPDAVVYSLLMGPTVGPFSFNWVGLKTEEGKLFAVNYTALQTKISTSGGSIGDVQNRNFLIEYRNAQQLTGITVEASSWQIDYTGRFNFQTEHMRAISRDMLGSQYFVGDGFKVARIGAQWKLKAGAGYVGGIRIEIGADTVFNAATLPCEIWLDCWMDKTVSTVEPKYQVIPVTDGVPLSDYTAVGGVKHYVAKISVITSTAVYSDLRRFGPVSDGIVANLVQSWNTFLTDFGGKTDFVRITQPTPLTKNSKYLSDNGLEHTLPDSALLNPGDAIYSLKKAGEWATYKVKNPSFENILFDGEQDTWIGHDFDGLLILWWNGDMWETVVCG